MLDPIRRLAARVSLLMKGRRMDLPAPYFPLAGTPWPRPIPMPRSPYALDNAPLDATAARSVRPYVHGLEAA